ncbi:MAG: glycogen/starch/alpha-glucan phosphorylase [Proteobacteria bacterium]|nr:glycogen/starch/alpha-glucan phosphorylase [Pseudomonadota bacterium]MBU1738625.1 glycogen/starch/alpha-glucan phosphorylase [Pseudomonadota bacterium]
MIKVDKMTKSVKKTGPACSYNAVDEVDVDSLGKTIHHHLLSFLGRDPERASNRDMCKALSYLMRDNLIEKWVNTQKSYYDHRKKRVYYLSLEFLIGRSLGNSLINMGLEGPVAKMLENLGYDLEDIREEEEDAALGNGGLGRLAACFLDSMATLGVPGYGYGIRYEYGLFFQRILNGFQVETPDNWMRYGSPWEFERPQYLHRIHFGGRVHSYHDREGKLRKEWVDTEVIMAMACDMLVPGYRNDQVINMRLWTAKASREFDLSYFSKGDYIAAVEEKVRSETVSKVLYPSDTLREGRELRLKQQYFFVVATFKDIMRRYKKKSKDFDDFSSRIAVQLNDTHPAIAIPELMRLLVDFEYLEWEKAWQICVETFCYTNHTLMPEALETWPVEMLDRVLPRHLEIIYEINHRFLKEVAERYPGDQEKLRNMSIIEEGAVKKVRMAHLAIVGSHSVNGVAELHTHLMKTVIFKDFHEYFPGRFNCKTNGITQRRWLLKCNPALAKLITGRIGDGWVTDLDQLQQLVPLADDPDFVREWTMVKHRNKVRLAEYIGGNCDSRVSPDSMFDVQVKRIHEYKRQMLSILHAITFYQRIIDDPGGDHTPRTIIFAGKAAPSYFIAKLIIKFINSVAKVINVNPVTNTFLKVVFIPNYGVSLAEKIFPASELSEQISTAGTEASGTGNMKFALNGALTIGTLDGANIEIMEEVGRENIFIFGMTAEEVAREKSDPGRTPHDIYMSNREIRKVIDSITDGNFSNGDRELFRPIVDSLMNPDDQYMLMKDFESYLDCQARVSLAYRNQRQWNRMSILNVARMGKFSSDRTIREYAREIWGIDVP